VITYVAIWSLKRGVIDPPEELQPDQQYLCQQEAILASMERDPPMTAGQRWHEELGRRQLARKRTA
jgi:hypothetical protein